MTVRDGDGTSGPGGADSATVTTQVQVAPGGPPPSGQPPSFTLPNHFALQYIEGATFATQIAREALITDSDFPDFGGGSLSVSKVDAAAGDQIGFVIGAGVVRSGSNLLYNNVVIGTVSGGANGSSPRHCLQRQRDPGHRGDAGQAAHLFDHVGRAGRRAGDVHHRRQ